MYVTDDRLQKVFIGMVNVIITKRHNANKESDANKDDTESAEFALCENLISSCKKIGKISCFVFI